MASVSPPVTSGGETDAVTARLMRLARDPGPPWLGTALLRLALAAMFIQAGAGKFINLDLYSERFERWGFGAAPTAMALLTGATELIGGLLLAELMELSADLGAAVCTLEVRLGNAAARRLYQEFGFPQYSCYHKEKQQHENNIGQCSSRNILTGSGFLFKL